MSRLIIVAGAGGAGKSFFLRLWAKNDSNACRIKKFVSEKRSPRKIEIETGESDLIFSKCYDPLTEAGAAWYKANGYEIPLESKLSYHNKTYNLSSKNNPTVYNYNGAYYEVDLESIKQALKEGKNPIVIVRKCETIKKLLELYPTALIIYVQSILSGKDLVERLVSLGESEVDAQKRQSRNLIDLRDYVESMQKLPNGIKVVINDFNEDEEGTVFAQIEDIYQEEIDKFHFKENSIFVIQSYLNTDRSENLLKEIRSVAKKVFGDNISVVQASDRQDGSYSIPKHVWDSLDESDYIICDVTSDRCNICDKKNPDQSPQKFYQGTSANVWLELGYAIARMRAKNIDLGKRLIIISENETKIPIDLGGTSLRIIRGTSVNELAYLVEKELGNMINQK